jgi:hypothetical protein
LLLTDAQLTLVLTEQIGQVRKDDFQIADEHGAMRSWHI